jgi:hypothetical protein
MNVRIMERALRRQHDLPDSFAFFSWQCMPPGRREPIYFELAGGECVPLKSGKNKGTLNYRKATNCQSFAVTVAEAEQMDVDYEAETGNCANCMGGGKEVARISTVSGIEYRECGKCKGSGRAGR